MQKPFQVTEEMLKEIDEEINKVTDAAAARPTSVTLRRRVEATPEDVTAQGPQALLNVRQSTHGDFRTNARLSQKLKEIYRSYEGWAHLDDVEKEVLDMISLKISRILSGKSLERQHWEDIEGYAHLALKECGQ